ncbi:MAG: dihydropteroate synthase [Anaerolineales bacterium]|nr:dihydropteroate synthase [Anaerolineales bacterium]
MKPASLTIGRRCLTWGQRTYVMGILNLTPDSFSGDGLLTSPRMAETGGEMEGVRLALAQAKHFLEAGADFLDVGGESTRPGSQPVSAEEEMSRVVPLIRAIATELPDVLISVDTYKAAVADEALKATDLLLRDRNIPLVILDLKLNPPQELRRIPSSIWFRFSRLVEHHGTTLLVITPQAQVGAADRRVRVECHLNLQALAAGPAAVVSQLEFQFLRTTEREMETPLSEVG